MLAAQCIFRRAAGVAGSGAEDVQNPLLASKNVFKQVADQLQRDILERQRRPIRCPQQREPRLECGERRDVVASENIASIRFRDDGPKIRRGNVTDELRQDRGGEIAIAELPQRLEFAVGEARIPFRNCETAVGRQSFEQDGAKRLRIVGPGAACADVAHRSEPLQASCSSRIRTILPRTVGSASIFAIASTTRFSIERCVSRMMSVWNSPSDGSF